MNSRRRRLFVAFRLLLLLLMALAMAAACKTIPGHEDIEHYYPLIEAEAEQEIAEARAKYESGEIRLQSYEAEVQRINDSIPGRVHDAVYSAYYLRESASGR